MGSNPLISMMVKVSLVFVLFVFLMAISLEIYNRFIKEKSEDKK